MGSAEAERVVENRLSANGGLVVVGNFWVAEHEVVHEVGVNIEVAGVRQGWQRFPSLSAAKESGTGNDVVVVGSGSDDSVGWSAC